MARRSSVGVQCGLLLVSLLLLTELFSCEGRVLPSNGRPISAKPPCRLAKIDTWSYGNSPTFLNRRSVAEEPNFEGVEALHEDYSSPTSRKPTPAVPRGPSPRREAPSPTPENASPPTED